MKIKKTWGGFKSIISDKDLPIQYKIFDSTTYMIWAYDNQDKYYCEIDIDTPANTDQTDFENNYKANANKKSINRSVIVEENVKKETGGHYQAQGYKLSLPASTGWYEKDISFPIPVSLLSALWMNIAAMVGDSFEFLVAPDTTIGAITADIAIDDTQFTVQQSVIDNIAIGYWVKLTDGINTQDVGRVISIDKTLLKITVETASTYSFLAATPTYVKMSVKMVVGVDLFADYPIEVGATKIGGSYINANTTLRVRYNNITGTAKDFRWILEYLY